VINLKWIRANKEDFVKSMKSRNFDIDIEEILNIDNEIKKNEELINNLRQAKNVKATQISKINSKTSKEFIQLRQDAEHINEKLTELATKNDIKIKLKEILDHIPNIPDSSVPIGDSEKMNPVIKIHGTPKKINNPKSHFDLGEALGMMDFEQSAKMSGSRYVSLSGSLAKLERALATFMLDTHIENGFTEISPPYIVRRSNV